MEVYLDSSATTKPYDEAALAAYESLRSCYGNPSSLHNLGLYAENEMNKARDVIAGSICAGSHEIYFTSGGTEANNLALIGFATANHRRGKRIVSTKMEHSSVTGPLLYLKNQGFDVVFADVDENGLVSLDSLQSLLTGDTILVSVMYINNETGAVQPIDKIQEMVEQYSPKAAFHVDAIQAYGKIPIDVRSLKMTMMSVSAHKIHGIKGAGALYVKSKTIINPIVFGGHQEKNLRSGTEAVPAILAFGKAAEISHQNIKPSAAHVSLLKKQLTDGILQIPDTVINGINDASYIVNASFGGLKSEVILHTLEKNGIYVSSGSACSSNKPSKSSTLSAMGLSDRRIDSAIRFSLSSQTTEEEIRYTAQVLKKEIPLLYQYLRKK